jgi:Uma2 family endonuclease
LPPHETYKRLLGRLVEIVTEEMDLEIRSLSASTWSRKDLLKGVEADECYYIQNEAAVRGKMEIDLTIDPPPDLAIKIDISNPSVPRLPIYAALVVPEVWQFDGKNLKILGLVAGGYVTQAQSQALPIVTVEIVTGLLVQAQEMGETSWAKAVRQWAKG